MENFNNVELSLFKYRITILSLGQFCSQKVILIFSFLQKVGYTQLTNLESILVVEVVVILQTEELQQAPSMNNNLFILFIFNLASAILFSIYCNK